jgi:hypothetical protein
MAMDLPSSPMMHTLGLKSLFHQPLPRCKFYAHSKKMTMAESGFMPYVIPKAIALKLSASHKCHLSCASQHSRRQLGFGAKSAVSVSRSLNNRIDSQYELVDDLVCSFPACLQYQQTSHDQASEQKIGDDDGYELSKLVKSL